MKTYSLAILWNLDARELNATVAEREGFEDWNYQDGLPVDGDAPARAAYLAARLLSQEPPC